MERATLYISVEGGCLTCVSSDHPERFADVDVVLVDYDTDGFDNTSTVHMADGRTSTARAEDVAVEKTCIADITEPD